MAVDRSEAESALDSAVGMLKDFTLPEVEELEDEKSRRHAHEHLEDVKAEIGAVELYLEEFE